MELRIMPTARLSPVRLHVAIRRVVRDAQGIYSLGGFKPDLAKQYAGKLIRHLRRLRGISEATIAATLGPKHADAVRWAKSICCEWHRVSELGAERWEFVRQLLPIPDRLQEVHRDELVAATVTTPPAEIQKNEGDEPRTTKKRSTERGEGRFKLIAALIAHHKYANGSCLNPAPIGNNELAKAAEVSTSTASTFFNEQFQGHTKYKAICRDIGKLVHSLKLLSGEFSPHDLYGSEPPEKRRDGRRSRQESTDD
jgi:hypothetical protein